MPRMIAAVAPAYWLPPVVWMAVIFGLSSDTASAEQTSRFLLPLVHWLLPWATSAQLDLLHAAARKSGHLVEYAVLAALWFRAFARGRGLAPRAASWLALAIAVVWAFVDEGHQSTLLSRNGSALDVGIDAGGAVLALAAARRGWRAALDRATGALLWIACVGGGAALAVNVWAGVPSGALWATAPAAALLLVIRWRRAHRGS
ncbi:MAG: VanZ family protein [Candidatus Rokubacteria bacterium]|nr:VanZ family protein [Candidatus Rokubacteria bacterium]